MPKTTRHTIAVAARGHGRRHRLKLACPDHVAHPTYDVTLARELLASTGQLPSSKHDLIVLLTEYRRALHDLTTDAAQSTHQAG